MPSAIDIKVFGHEPSWNVQFENEIDRRCAIGKALNWYNYMSDCDEHKQWLLDYMKINNYSRDTIDHIKSLSPDQIQIEDQEIPGCIGFATGVFARMIVLNAPLDSKDINTFKQAIAVLQNRRKIVKKEVAVKPNVQQHIDQQFSKIVEVLDIKFDAVLNAAPVAGSTQVNLEKALKNINKQPTQTVSEVANYINGLKNIYCKKIADYYQPIYKEICEAINNTDPQIVEAYSGYRKINLSNLKKLIEDIIKNCNIRIENDRKMPVIRRKRRKSPIDVVKKLKYRKDHKEYGLVSMLPSKIVDAQRLLVFNCKYRTVTLFEADSSHGLSVKGTTIIGFDEKKSHTKKLRKPKEFFDKIKNKGIKAVRAAFDAIRCTEKTAKGRINEETILYGVYE